MLGESKFIPSKVPRGVLHRCGWFAHKFDSEGRVDEAHGEMFTNHNDLRL